MRTRSTDARVKLSHWLMQSDDVTRSAQAYKEGDCKHVIRFFVFKSEGSQALLLDLHTEGAVSWRFPYSVREANTALIYSNVEGLCENGYGTMPRA